MVTCTEDSASPLVTSISTLTDKSVESTNNTKNLFRKPAEFLEEKPRQITCGCLLLLFLLYLAYHDRIITKTKSIVSKFPVIYDDCSKRTETYRLIKHLVYNLCENEDNFDIETKILPEEPKNILQYKLFENEEFVKNFSPVLRRCLLAILVSLSIYAFLQTKDGVQVRPHPGFWRIVHALGLFYFLFLCIFLIISPEAGRTIIALIFPDIQTARSMQKENAHTIFEGTLELDCKLTGWTILRQLRTPWFFSHVIGWLVKMCIFRNWLFCLLYSASFEFCELSFQWMVPELKECWWDSIILDYFFANIIGMILGVWCLRLIKSYQYDWIGRRPIYQKALVRFLPFTWSNYDWSFFKNPWRFVQSIPLLLFSNIGELNVFMIMHTLDIPACHYINPSRCVYICSLGIAAVAEHYAYMNGNGERLGHNQWLLVLILLLESLICLKYGVDKVDSFIPPLDVFISWGLSGLLFGIWCISHFSRQDRLVQENENNKKIIEPCKKSNQNLIDSKTNLSLNKSNDLDYITSPYHVASVSPLVETIENHDKLSDSPKLDEPKFSFLYRYSMKIVRKIEFFSSLSPIITFVPLIYLTRYYL